MIQRTYHLLFVSAAARDGGARRCVHARSVRSVSIVRAPLLLRTRSVEFSGEIGSPLFEQPSVQIRNLIRSSNLDNKRRPPDGFGWTTLGRIILFCTSSSLSSSLGDLGNLHCRLFTVVVSTLLIFSSLFVQESFSFFLPRILPFLYDFC